MQSPPPNQQPLQQPSPNGSAVPVVVIVLAVLAGGLVHLREATCGHIVLLDWVLLGPGESLLHVLEQEPTDGPLHRRCYIVLTAAELSRFTDEERRLIAATCLTAVAKPFDVAELLAVNALAARGCP